MGKLIGTNEEKREKVNQWASKIEKIQLKWYEHIVRKKEKRLDRSKKYRREKKKGRPRKNWNGRIEETERDRQRKLRKMKELAVNREASRK